MKKLTLRIPLDLWARMEALRQSDGLTFDGTLIPFATFATALIGVAVAKLEEATPEGRKARLPRRRKGKELL